MTLFLIIVFQIVETCDQESVTIAITTPKERTVNIAKLVITEIHCCQQVMLWSVVKLASATGTLIMVVITGKYVTQARVNACAMLLLKEKLVIDVR